MTRLGYDIREDDPFTERVATNHCSSPFAARIRLMWGSMRNDVIANFSCSKSNLSPEEFLALMDAQYRLDAYHSLSIEGYRVTNELINRVKSGDWQPNGLDSESREGLAARGYWQAFQEVKKSVTALLIEGKSGSEVAKNELSTWYYQLFAPAVQASILKPSDLIGYRTNQVYIRNSRHTPPHKELLRDGMNTLFELLETETHSGVKAILGHFIFTFIHPYTDGNGRTARFLMNLMLAEGGYSWVIIPVEQREEYMKALETASVDGDIVPFTKFISSL